MASYRVVKISQQWAGQRDAAQPYETLIVSDAGSKESALVLAEVACSEHADGISVQYQPCGNLRSVQTGFTFRTNNGTDVWYVVKPNFPWTGK